MRIDHDQRDRQSLISLAVELLNDIYRRVGADEATRVRPSVERVISGDSLRAIAGRASSVAGHQLAGLTSATAHERDFFFKEF